MSQRMSWFDLTDVNLFFVQLTEVRTPVDDIFDYLDSSGVTRPYFTSAKQLFLGTHHGEPGGEFLWKYVTHECLDSIFRLNKNIESLNLLVDSSETIRMTEQLVSLRCLSLRAAPYLSFECLEVPLKKFALEKLWLMFFQDVSLSSIAENCGYTLRSLSLTNCKVSLEHILPGAYSNLVSLNIGSSLSVITFCSLLASCPMLVSLQLECASACLMLVKEFVLLGYSLDRLERLTMGISKEPPGFSFGQSELSLLFERLPSLRYLATDCYKIRLFCERYKPEVKLAWTDCTVCAARFPQMGPHEYTLSLIMPN